MVFENGKGKALSLGLKRSEGSEKNGAPADCWIDRFEAYTHGKPSPRRFLYWAGITVVSVALGRKVFLMAKSLPSYPNVFSVLATGPAGGKSVAVNEAKKFLRA